MTKAVPQHPHRPGSSPTTAWVEGCQREQTGMHLLARLLAWMMAILLVTGPVIAVVGGWVGASRWPLMRLRVTGELQRVDPEQIRQVLVHFAQTGFFAVPLVQAKAAVERLPWVESAQLRKQWPDLLLVTVTERHPYAHWGSHQLLSEHGQLFTVPGGARELKLPQLSGPENKTAEVVALYNDARVCFAPIGFDITHVSVDQRGSWSLSLSNGLEILAGRDDVRPRLYRFARVLPQLLQSQPPISKVDLRYTNGFAASHQMVAPSQARLSHLPPNADIAAVVPSLSFSRLLAL